MILLIDNFDSFTYNIFQYLKKMSYEVVVKRNNEVTVSDVEEMGPSHIIISPGPGRPESAGVSVEVIRHFTGKVPILGICLGHQCICAAFGGEIVRAPRLYHGKESEIIHDGKGVFNGLANPFKAIRYHSLVIQNVSLPPELEVSASTEEGDIMAIRHKRYFLVGLQFHPESIGTEHGYRLLQNFLDHKPESSRIRSAIRKVFSGAHLSEEEARKVMDEITSGEASPAQIACILTAMSLKGESVSELTGFAGIMRKKALSIKKPEGEKVIDTCGTGGDARGTFNISTIAAFVAAGAGVKVAKHGNRSVTSRCGSADLLEALGVNILAPPETMAKALETVGIAFLFAPRFHLSMKYAVSVRKDMGVRTAFNILGPLANPAGADYQLIGVFDKGLTETVSRVLLNLGVERAMVVHGSDGLDEITLTGGTTVSELNNGWIKNYTLDPAELDLKYCTPEDLKGGDLKTNCDIAMSVLNGEKGPRRDAVVLNAAAAIYLAGKADGLAEAVQKAGLSIDEGAALGKLDGLIAAAI